MTNVRTISLAVSVQVEGHPSADEIASSVREDFAVSPIEGQVACEVTVAGQSDSDEQVEERSPAYIAVLLANGALLASPAVTYGPFTDSAAGSAWRRARSFVENNLDLAGGDPARWVVCELTAPSEAA